MVTLYKHSCSDCDFNTWVEWIGRGVEYTPHCGNCGGKNTYFTDDSITIGGNDNE